MNDDDALALQARVRWLEAENDELREYIAAWHAWVRASESDTRSAALETLLLLIDQRRRSDGTFPAGAD